MLDRAAVHIEDTKNIFLFENERYAGRSVLAGDCNVQAVQAVQEFHFYSMATSTAEDAPRGIHCKWNPYFFALIVGRVVTLQHFIRDASPEPTEHCEVCSWFPLCDSRRRADDHPSFVAGISRNQQKALAGRGVSTVAALAKLPLPPTPKIERIGDAALLRIREQARLQVQGRVEGRLAYELLDDSGEGNGLAALPLPSSADVFLDFEANPYVLDQGLEYLIGIVTLPTDSVDEPIYESLWAASRAEERTRNVTAEIFSILIVPPKKRDNAAALRLAAVFKRTVTFVTRFKPSAST